MVEKIKIELDKYLEFDSSKLFNKKYIDLACVFGGSIRDIVSGDSDKINDIDIIGLPVSLYFISEILVRNGFVKMNLVKPNIYKIYKDIKFIFEPLTYINNNHKIVQLIRPCNNINYQNRPPNNFQLLKQNYFYLLSNVDLTSSGLFYDGEDLFESVNYAYTHCKLKIYDKLPNALMYNEERTNLRSGKLEYKGIWKENSKDKLVTRTIKIHQIKNKNLKTLDDYIYKTKKFIPIERDIPRLMKL
jgi:hypothetical protein